MTTGVARAVGFVVTMIGLGLKLDSTWQTTATLVLLVGCGVGGWGLVAGAFVHEESEG